MEHVAGAEGKTVEQGGMSQGRMRRKGKEGKEETRKLIGRNIRIVLVFSFEFFSVYCGLDQGTVRHVHIHKELSFDRW